MALTPIQALRIQHGDLDEDCPYLTDEEYQHFIDSYPSKKKLSKAIDLAILNVLSYLTRERSGQEEKYGNQAFENRLKLLDKKYKDPAFNGNNVAPIIGGVDVDDMRESALDPNRVPDTFYKGQWIGRGEWQGHRHYKYIGSAIEPETCRWYPLWHLRVL